MNSTVDLTRLVEELRAAGFKVDTRQYLTAHQLLLVLAAKEGRVLDGDPKALSTHLGPIFCTSREEQERFGDILRGHLGEPTSSPVPPGPEPSVSEPRRRDYWKWLGAAAVLIALLLAGAALYRHYAKVEIIGRVETEPKAAQLPKLERRPSGEPVPLEADGTFRLRMAPADGVQQLHAELKDYDSVTASVTADAKQPVVLTLRQVLPPPPLPDSRLRVKLSRQVAEARPSQKVLSPDWFGAMMRAAPVACLTYLALGLAAWLRRRLALFQYPIDKRPEFTTLAGDALPVPQLAGASLRRLAAALRRRRATGELEFDMPSSVEGAARNGGLLKPVFAPRRVLPEYLALVQRLDAEDHQARLFETLLDALQHHGVVVERYFFEEDPRVCFSRDEPTRPRRLAELVSRHHRASLLLLSEAETCFNPRTGKPAPWLRSLKVLSRRALLTPAPPAQWTPLEWKLAEAGFDVVPAIEEALATYAASEATWRLTALFPAPYARPFPASLRAGGARWIERYAPSEAELVLLERELQDYLGPEGFAWLAACAVYPAIAVPVTLDVGQTLKGVGSGMREERGRVRMLAALARLPWFRHGSMPEWLRRLLLARLTPEQETAVRRRMFERLDALAQRTLAAGGEGEEKAGLRIAGWVGPVDLLRTAPPESPMGDAVFLAYMSGARFDSPVLEAPGRLRRLFHRLGWARLREPGLMRKPRSWGERLRARLRAVALFRPRFFRGMVALTASLLTWGVLASTLLSESTPSQQEGVLTAFAFSSDGSRMVLGRGDGTVEVRDVASGGMVASFLRGTAMVEAAAGAKASMVVTASAGGDIAVWDTMTAAEPLILSASVLASSGLPPGRSPRVVTLSPDLVKLAILWQDGRATVLNFSSGNVEVHPNEPHPITALGFEDGGAFVIVFRDGAVWRWQVDAELPEKGALAPFITNDVIALLRSRLVPTDEGGALLVDASDTIRVWDTRFGYLLRTLSWDAEPVVSATVSRDRKWVAAASSSGSIRLWSLADGALLAELQQPGVNALHFAPDSQSLATVTDQEVRLWPLEAVKRGPNPRQVSVPGVIGMKLTEAQEELKRVGLRPQPIPRGGWANLPDSETALDSYIVVEQDPEAGTLGLSEEKVSLTVILSERVPRQRTTVPDVRGLNQEEAEAELSRARLNGRTPRGADSKFSAVNSRPEGRVTRQKPEPGASVEADSFVELVFEMPKRPVLLRVAPQQIGPGIARLLIKGGNFESPMQVSLPKGITTRNVSVVDSHLLEVDVEVSPNAPPGSRSLTVRNSSGEEATLPNALKVVVKANEMR